SCEPDHVHLHALPGKIVKQGVNKPVRLVVQVKRAVNKVHTDHTERLLLAGVFFVEHPDVDNDFGGFLPWRSLEPNAHPTAPLLLTREAASRHCVREGKESALVAVRFFESFLRQIELVCQHRLEALTADVTFCRTVNGVAHRHVVSGNGLGYRTSSAADVEEP